MHLRVVNVFFRGSVITRRNDASPKRLREDFEVVEVGWVSLAQDTRVRPLYAGKRWPRTRLARSKARGGRQEQPRRKTGAAATPRLITRVRSFAPVPGHSQAKMVHDVPLLAKYCRSTEPRTPSAHNLWWHTPQRQARLPPLPLFLSSESSRDETKSRPGHLKTWTLLYIHLIQPCTERDVLSSVEMVIGGVSDAAVPK